MEFVEEQRRPRFLFQAGRGAGLFAASAATAEEPNLDKLHTASCLSAAAVFLFLAYLSLSGTETLASLLLWAALSLALGAFSPPSSTGGDCRVGRGDPLPDPEPAPAHSDLDEPKKRIQGRRARSKKPEDPPPPPLVPVVPELPPMAKIKDPVLDNDSGSANHVKSEENDEEKEWTDEDFELLKRQISKHPVGEPRRWERIAEAFRGQHGLDSVITTAKSLSERRPASGDSYQQFLKQRKPVDKRVVAAEMESPLRVGNLMENGDSTKENGGGAEKWSSGEDIALLNALKTFPKDVAMRWEKVAAAVPGKSKAACMKRVAELKRNFRTSKVTDA